MDLPDLRCSNIQTNFMKQGLSLTRKLSLISFIVFFTCLLQMSFAQGKSTKQAKYNITFTALDTLAIEKIIGIKGKTNNGEYKITIPQNDLAVMVDGFKIIPAMGLGTWVAFTPAKDGAMIMGDIVLTENDLGPVQQEIIKQGLTSTAIHNHFVRNNPNIIYMHVGGSGTTESMAQKAKAV